MQAAVPAVSFPLVSNADQIQPTWSGPSADLEPPDTQVAVGPGAVVEFVNQTGTIWTKTGGLVSHFDLNGFFRPPAGLRVSDPQVLYDGASGRWFASIMAFALSSGSAAGEAFLAVSQTSNPGGSWYIYPSGETLTGIFDQPFLGLNQDKVVLSWNDFDNTNTFTEEETYVFDKAEVMSGHDPDVALLIAGDSARYRLAPARSLTATSTEYITYNNSDCAYLGCTNPAQPSVGVLAVTGTPAAHTVAFTETDLSMLPTTVPPNASQPGCATVTACGVVTNDDIFLGAVYDNGALWTGGNDGCIPSGDTTTRSCMRLAGIDVTGSSPALLGAGDIAVAGWDLYYPAVLPYGAGDVGVAFTQSSATVDPEVAGTALAVGVTTLTVVPLAVGQTTYGGTRWGDYSSAAVDPASGLDWWLAGENSSTGCCGGLNWGTAVAELTGKLAFTAQPPPSSPAGATFNTSVQVADPFGDLLPSVPVTLAIHGGPAGAALHCAPNPVTTTSAGVAAFNCSITKAGSGYRLSASASGLAAVSSGFSITPGSPSKLAFTTEPPTGAASATNFATGIGVEDAYGNLVTTDNSTPVRLALHTGPPGATLRCDHDPVTVSAGVARFTCAIAKDGSGYSLAATTSGLATAVSTGFTVGPAGYWLDASDGGIFTFGHLSFYGSTGNLRLNQPMVGMAATPDAKGYWLVAGDGGIFAFGDAHFYGSTGGIALNKPIVGMATDPATGGYWLVASDGGIFGFHAPFHGSTGNLRLTQPIVGMAATPDGGGYWLVARDGGIFTFGDAHFYGSTGAITLNKPIVGMAADPTTGGYWLVASDGGIFGFHAPFYGSTGGIALNKPIVGMATDPVTGGYWLVASDGGIFSFHAPFYGSTGGIALNKPIVGMTN
jgi:hypothetical protein